MKRLYILILIATVCSWCGITAATVTLDFESGIPADWTNTNFAEYTSLNHTAAGAKCLSTDGKQSASLVSKTSFKDVSQIVFYISKTSTNKNANSYFVVSTSPDGTTWTEQGKSTTFDKVTQNEWTEVNVTLETPVTGYVKIAYSGTTAVRVIDDITITYTDAVLEAPTITGVKDGDIYYSAITIGASLPEVATSFSWEVKKGDAVVASATNVTEAQAYNCTDEGTYTVSVSATDGTDTESNSITFTIGSNVVTSVAEFIEKGSKEATQGYTLFEINCRLDILYRCGYFLQANGHSSMSPLPILIYSTSMDAKYQTAGIIFAGTKAKYQLYNGVPEMVDVELGTLDEHNAIIANPFFSVTTAYVNATEYDGNPVYMSDFIEIKNVTFDVANKTITDAAGTVPYLLYSGGPNNPTDLTIKYNVEGFLYNNGTSNCLHISKITPVDGAFGTPVLTLNGEQTTSLGQVHYLEGTTLDFAIPYGAAYCTVSGVLGIEETTHYTENASILLEPGVHKDITVKAYNDADEEKTSATIADNTVVVPSAPILSLENGIYLESQEVTATYPGSFSSVTVALWAGGENKTGNPTVSTTLAKVPGEEKIYTFGAFTLSSDGSCTTPSDTRKVLISSTYVGSATATLDIAAYAAANGWEDGKNNTSAYIDDVTFTMAGSTNTGKYYTSDQSWRMYKSESGTLTISVPSHCVINSIKIYDSNIGTITTASVLNEEGVATANGNLTPSTAKGSCHIWRTDVEALTNTVTFGFDETSSANAQITKIEVECFYTTTSGVEGIAVDDANAEAEYYNLQGVRVAHPAAGNIYIRRVGNTATKILY